jgi:hypothetical protein
MRQRISRQSHATSNSSASKKPPASPVAEGIEQQEGWFPMSSESLTQHEERFDGWPVLRQAVGAQMPAADGDMAELEELSERVFDAVKDGAEVPRRAGLEWGEDDIFWTTFVEGCFRPNVWPDDRAVEQLAEWRFELDHGVIA